MKSKPRHWPKDVASTSFRMATTLRRKVRQSRALDLRSEVVRLVHKPTGITVEGRIPEGHYSRNEMRSLRMKLEDALLEELRSMVSARLRLPRRTPPNKRQEPARR